MATADIAVSIGYVKMKKAYTAQHNATIDNGRISDFTAEKRIISFINSIQYNKENKYYNINYTFVNKKQAKNIYNYTPNIIIKRVMFVLALHKYLSDLQVFCLKMQIFEYRSKESLL
ncbi:hypothetical protein GW750_03030 [bacterium]|nr:hypothetical protein [bacterium]